MVFKTLSLTFSNDSPLDSANKLNIFFKLESFSFDAFVLLTSTSLLTTCIREMQGDVRNA